MKRIFSISLFLFLLTGPTFAQQKSAIKNEILTQEQIIERFLKKGAWRNGIFTPEWQSYIDSAIAINPNIAYLYQQKAMPLFKQGKYEVGIKILDKAVQLEPQAWIDYRAFIKCVFAKTYREAIQDFIKSKELKGEFGIVMDHTYNFYMGLCYLQLNEHAKALEYLKITIDRDIKTRGEKWVHHLDTFYAGIACYELQKHNEAIKYFDLSLANYSNFSDAEYYKAISLFRIKKLELAKALMEKCKQDLKAGYTITEDNVIYEKYPYQIAPWMVDIKFK